ncbi:MAG: hypothetical protein Q8P05_02500 [Candidatus Diapherotrites archaeon]|nr:hypothetical protein [Candidatus Diapherotrites archaeon]
MSENKQFYYKFYPVIEFNALDALPLILGVLSGRNAKYKLGPMNDFEQVSKNEEKILNLFDKIKGGSITIKLDDVVFDVDIVLSRNLRGENVHFNLVQLDLSNIHFFFHENTTDNETVLNNWKNLLNIVKDIAVSFGDNLFIAAGGSSWDFSNFWDSPKMKKENVVTVSDATILSFPFWSFVLRKSMFDKGNLFSTDNIPAWKIKEFDDFVMIINGPAPIGAIFGEKLPDTSQPVSNYFSKFFKEQGLL